MFQQLIQQFTQSRQGQTAFSRLQAQGFSPQQSQSFLGAAVPVAAQSFHAAQSGGFAGSRPGGPAGLMDVGNSHYVTNFLSGAVSGLIRGEGIIRKISYIQFSTPVNSQSSIANRDSPDWE